jgi:aminoglycoside phosphotransferase (APT) family kinase protein
MITEADGLEVVDSLDGLDLDQPPLLVLDRITEFLDERDLGSGPVAWHRIGDGQSNITYKLARGGESWVLRRGPRPPLPPSTHDMAREARILRALRPHGVPVPEVVEICETNDVLGVSFYLMRWLDGAVITDEIPTALSTASQRRATTGAMVRTLAQLHTVDTNVPEISALGRPDGYLARQVSRFSGLWEANGGRPLPEVANLADWLERNLPTSQRASVVHGDYRLGNIMFGDREPARVLAVLDWEMATLGDPLSDLGYLIATYTEEGAERNPLHMSPVTAQPGYHTRAELVAEYADRTGLDISGLDWYRVLALWKAAVFCEAIFARWARGERPGDQFGPRLERGVPLLLSEARSIAAI